MRVEKDYTKIIAIFLAVIVLMTGVTGIIAGCISISTLKNIQVAGPVSGGTQVVSPTAAPGTPAGVTPTSPAATPAAQTTAASGNTATTASGSTATTAASANPGTPAQQEPAQSSGMPEGKAAIVEYFNTAINKVKPSAKKVTLNREFNSMTSELKLDSSFLEGIANPLVEKNMGEKELTDDLKYAETVEAKNKIFPVENESWSSQLTEENVKNATISESGGIYTIVIETYDDAPDANTAHGAGNNGKVFSVIETATITANAGAASGIISDLKTGHANGKITITVDSATGNVLTAHYYFEWSLNLTADVKIMKKPVSVTFGLEKVFSIDW